MARTKSVTHPAVGPGARTGLLERGAKVLAAMTALILLPASASYGLDATPTPSNPVISSTQPAQSTPQQATSPSPHQSGPGAQATPAPTALTAPAASTPSLSQAEPAPAVPSASPSTSSLDTAGDAARAAMRDAVGPGGAEMGQRSPRQSSPQAKSGDVAAADSQVSAQGTWTPSFGIQGLDVSWYQSSVDWQQQWNMGARFAYVKASEGNYYTNPAYGSQYQGSRNVGMIRGAYHFAIPNWSSGADQARYFVENGGSWVADGFTLPPVLDFEFNPYAGRTIEGFYFGNTCYDMSPAELTSWVRDFGNTVKSLTGRLPVIYTNTGWWNQCTGDAAGFGDYPLWVASYPSSPSNDAGPIPSSWNSYSIWQYSSTGPFAGDSNVWNGDYESLKEFAGAPATGSFDDLSMTRDGGTVYLRSRGWAVDLARPWVSSDVHIYVTDPSNVTKGYAFRADKYRPDVDAAFGYGPAHGFDNNIKITASGTYKVCAYAIGTFGNKLLACKTFQASGVEPPMGSFDSLGQVRTPDKVSLRLTGWAIDRANPQSPAWADAYVTGPDGKTAGYRIPANVTRTDVDAAFHLGSAHGFDKLIDIALPGSYQVCVHAIGQYANTALGCRQLTVETNPPPVGSYDTLRVVQAPGSAKLQVTGWALDKAKPAGSVPVHVYVKSPDGANVGYAFTADKPRPDVNGALGVTGNHGFESTVDVNSTGIYTVCAYAIPIAPLPSGNTALGCKTIHVSSTPAPQGYVDKVSVEIASGAGYGILTQGWTYDPGVPGSSNPVHVYVTYPNGSRSGFAFTADRQRADVNAAFGISGNHGYSAFVPITQRGQYSVCAYGIGIAEFSAGNTLLGCRSLNY